MALIEHNFCSVCGAATIKVMAGGFDKQSGKPLTKTECSSGKCEHDGIDHQWKVGYRFGRFFPNTVTCQRCGVSTPLPRVD